MFSYLQYRRIGQAVERQLQRDQEKATVVPDNDVNESALPIPRRGSQNEKESPSDESSSQENEGSSVPRIPQQPDSLLSTPTHHTEKTALGYSLAGISARDRTTREGKGGHVFVVGWDGQNDPMNLHNYSHLVRVGTTLMVAAIAFVVTAASSIDAAILPQAAAEFGVSDVVETLATGNYLIGFGIGTLFAGPLSETFGRNLVYIGSLVMFSIFIMASGLAPNIGAQITFRFFAGFFGSPPLTCAGGTVSDLWNSLEKTYAFPLFAISGFGGPTLGPVIGSYMGTGAPSWRWTEWTILIISGAVLTLVILLQPETFPLLLLKWKAQHLRRLTGDDRYRAESEIIHQNLWQRLRVALIRPFALAREPIVILMTIYLTMLYIVLFTFLDGYTFIYSDVYKTPQGLTNVFFVAMFIGVLLGMPLVGIVYSWTRKDLARIRALGGFQINPEYRLWFAMFGGSIGIPLSLFWMAWTDYSSISIWSPIAAGVPFGYGIICIFLSAYMYIIDSYEMYAASALTFVALVRYVVAGGMTVVGIPFYKNLGTHWTLTILGCISVLMVPIPYLFYKKGYEIRKRSKYAVNREE